jgi:hypothetical protein
MMGEAVIDENLDFQANNIDHNGVNNDVLDGVANSKIKHARRKRLKKKRSKSNRMNGEHDDENLEEVKKEDVMDDEDEKINVEIEYVAPKEDGDDDGAAFFAHVFAKFAKPEDLTAAKSVSLTKQNQVPIIS